MKRKLKAVLAVILALTLNISMVVAAHAEIATAFDSVSEALTALTASESVWDGSSSASPVYDSAQGAYIIDSAAKLRGFFNNVNSKTTYAGQTVKITVDINLNGKTWSGANGGDDYTTCSFQGTLDGGNHYISNFTHTDMGLFRFFYNTTIKNIVFKNVNTSSTTNGNRYAGGLCCSSRGNTVIDNVDFIDSYYGFTYSDSKSSRHAQNGIMIGIVDGGTVTFRNCDFTNVTEFSRDSRTGTFVGNSVSGTTVNAYTCSFSNTYLRYDSDRCTDMGLIVGMAEGNVNIDGVNITDNTRLNLRNGSGGLVGQVASGYTLTMKNITADGLTVTGSSDSTGGLAGYIPGNIVIENVTMNDLTLTGATTQSGGVAGYIGGTSTVKNVTMNNAKVSISSNDCGTVLGKTIGTISLTDITINGATVSNNGTCLGGVVGYNDNGGTAYFTGITLTGNISLTDTGGDYCGAILGNYNPSNTLYFYDINTKDATITRSVSNKSYQGQLVGHSKADVVIDTKNTALNELGAINISSGGNKIGGLVGWTEGKSLTVRNTRVNGNIVANSSLGTTFYDYAGGICGQVDSSLTLSNFTVTGSISVNGDERAAGFAGHNGSGFSFSNVTVGGAININTTNQDAGGIIGYYASGTASTMSGINLPSVSITATSGGSDVGGLIGWCNNYVTIKNCSIGTLTINTQGTRAGGFVGGCQSGIGVTVTDSSLGTVKIADKTDTVGGIAAWIRGDTTISNVSIDTVTLSSQDPNYNNGKIGGFIGCANGNLTITGSEIKNGGTISGPCNLGGAVGLFESSGGKLIIENYANHVNITPSLSGTTELDSLVGGTVGNIASSTAAAISGCSNDATLSASTTTSKLKYFGGIVGRANATTTIANCYNEGIIRGNAFNGGIVGNTQSSVTISYCYNSGAVSAYSSNTLTNSYTSAGGIVGISDGASTIQYCFNRGNISAYSTSGYYVGGIVGNLNNSGAKVQYCYSTGAVTTPSTTYFRGTIVGKINSGSVSYCYSTATGALTGGGTASSSYTRTDAQMKGSAYTSNTELGTVYFAADSSGKNDNYPILYWMGDPFEKNEDGVWEIWNAGHYSQFLSKVNTGTNFAGETVRLMDDVDLADITETTSIGGNGATTNSFRGTFDGNNHTFSNFTLNNGSTSNTGFFGYVYGATIKDLTLSNFRITGGEKTGGLVGYADGSNTFSNIKITNGISVTGGKYTGGLVGYSTNTLSLNGFTSTGTIDVNCGTQSGGILGYTPAAISFTDISLGAVDVDSTAEYTGGLVGIADGTAVSTIKNLSASGVIDVYTTTGSYIGGIAGRVDGNFTIDTTSGTTSLSGINVRTGNGANVGGISGNHSDGSGSTTIRNLNTGNITVTSTGNNTGGLVGYSKTTTNIQNVSAGNVTMNAGGGSSVAAFVGWGIGAVTINGTNSIGNVTVNATGKYNAGIVGECDSSIYISGLAAGDITVNGSGNTDAGGFTGNAASYTTVTGCSAGTVRINGTGNTRGGVIAYAATTATVSGTTLTAVYIGTSDSKAAAYTGGLIGLSDGSASVSSSSVQTVTIYSSNEYNGGLIGRSVSSSSVTNSGVSRVTIDASGRGGGLIGSCVGATISSGYADVCSLTLNGNYKGGFVGICDGSGNLSFSGTNRITTLTFNNSNYSYVGTFAGFVGGKITVSGTTTSVPSNFSYSGTSTESIEQVGAIAGYAGSADISGLHFGTINIGTSDIRAKKYTGGFIGRVNAGDFIVKDCSVDNLVVFTGAEYKSGGTFSHSSSFSQSGGLVGQVSGAATLENVTISSLTFTAEGTTCGGIIGAVGGTATFTNVKVLSNTSSVSTKQFETGGFIGYAGGDIKMTDCTNYANVSCNEVRGYFDGNNLYLAGFVGKTNSGTATFTNCKNYGKVTSTIGKDLAAGFVGNLSVTGTFTNCENYGGINTTAWYAGGLVANAATTVAFVGCKNFASVVSGSRSGGMVGQTAGKATFDNCTNSGIITASGEYAGGMVGNCNSADSANFIKNSTNSGTVTATGAYCGGIAGVGKANITSCSNTGTINGADKTGGIVGYIDAGYTYTGCTNSSPVNGASYVGGIVGQMNNTSMKVELSKNTSAVTGTGNYVGGIIGSTGTSNGGTISKCYNTGSVKGASYTGGIIGQCYANMNECFNTGNISTTSTDAESYVGGVIGVLNGGNTVTANYCYNIGDITILNGAGKVGGFVGTFNAKLSNCYSVGTINNANATSGSVVGYIYTTDAGSMTAVYGISAPTAGSLNSTTDKSTLVDSDTLEIMRDTAALSTSYFVPVHDETINKAYPALKWYITAEYPDNDADYTAVDDALAAIPGNLSDTYTPATVAALNTAKNAVVRDYKLLRQYDVDTMAININKAIMNLEKLVVVTLNSTGATTHGTTFVKAVNGEAMPSITPPSKTGYAFTGYYINEDGTGVKYYLEDGTSAKNLDTATNFTLYAGWEANKYSVTLDSQEATQAGSTSVTASYGEALPAIALPKKTGYAFNGYFTQPDGKGDKYYDSTGAATKIFTLSEGITLYASWSANKYTVTFKNYTGTILQSSSWSFGTRPVYSGATPTKASDINGHYTFSGWSPAITTVSGEASYTAEFTLTEHSYIYKNIGGKHQHICSVCGYVEAESEHTFDNDGHCIYCDAVDTTTADYTAVDRALASIPENMEYYYTPESIANVNNAKNSVVRNLYIARQAQVDKMAQDILNAIAGLQYIEFEVTSTDVVHIEYSTRQNSPYKVACVNAPKTDELGRNFSYWVDVTNGTPEIVSSYTTYYFFICRNIRIEPVYGADYTTAEIATRVMNVRDNNDGTSSLLVEHSVSKSHSINMHGVLFTTDPASASDLTVGNSNTKVYDTPSASTATTRSGLFEVVFNNYGTKVYARPYIIDRDTGEAFYGKTVEYSINDASMSSASSSASVLSLNEMSSEDISDLQPDSGETDNGGNDSGNSLISTILSILTKVIEFILSLIVIK